MPRTPRRWSRASRSSTRSATRSEESGASCSASRAARSSTSFPTARTGARLANHAASRSWGSRRAGRAQATAVLRTDRRRTTLLGWIRAVPRPPVDEPRDHRRRRRAPRSASHSGRRATRSCSAGGIRAGRRTCQEVAVGSNADAVAFGDVVVLAVPWRHRRRARRRRLALRSRAVVVRQRREVRPGRPGRRVRQLGGRGGRAARTRCPGRLGSPALSPRDRHAAARLRPRPGADGVHLRRRRACRRHRRRSRRRSRRPPGRRRTPATARLVEPADARGEHRLPGVPRDVGLRLLERWAADPQTMTSISADTPWHRAALPCWAMSGSAGRDCSSPPSGEATVTS